MAIRISKRGIAGKDLNTAWTSGAPAAGITKNIFRWGPGGVDQGNDEVGLIPYAYVLWSDFSNVTNGAYVSSSRIYRNYNVSSIYKTNTGRYTVYFNTGWNSTPDEYGDVVPFINGQRFNSGTSTTSILRTYLDDPLGMLTNRCSFKMKDTGNNYRNPSYAWFMAFAPGRYEIIPDLSTSNVSITGRRMSKSYTPTGANTMHASAYARINLNNFSTGTTNTRTDYYPSTTSITKLGTGLLSWSVNVSEVNGSNTLDGTTLPMIFATSRRPGTATAAMCSIPSNSQYGMTTAFRCHNASNTAQDHVAHLVMY